MSKREGYERMLRLAAYVGEHRGTGCTIRDIAENVPGFQHQADDALARALARDLKELDSSLGIVIAWSEDRQRYEIQPPMFTAGERRALLSAAAAVDVDGVGDELAPNELGAAVDSDRAQVVVRVHQLVVDLRDAIAARRRISFHYQGTSGDAEVRDVDPYAVGMWRNRWYLLGHDHDRGARRVFRLDRIQAADDGEVIAASGEPDSFTLPDDVDLRAALTMDPNNWGTDPPLAAEVRVLHDHVPTFLGEFAGTVLDEDATSARITLEVRDYESFVIRLLGLGTGVRLLGPPELCDRLHHWLSAQAVS